jgi:mannitol/fructose-specific phosphotransferase system IIA component (Ntr-type)
MKIHKLINSENVFLDLAAADVESALAAVANVFSPCLSLEPQGVIEALVEREELGSTSVGDGFAIPHCKTQGLRQIAIALARFNDGVDFGGSGHDPVRFVFAPGMTRFALFSSCCRRPTSRPRISRCCRKSRGC